MRALPVSNNVGKGGSGGSSTAVFFSFICSSLLSLLYIEGQKFVSLPEAKTLAMGVPLLLLLTAAYTGSCYGRMCLPIITVVMGMISACGFCLVALELKEGETDGIYLLPVLLLAVPLQFVMSVSGMKTAALLRKAMRESACAAAFDMRAQNIMVFLSAAAAAGLMVYIILR